MGTEKTNCSLMAKEMLIVALVFLCCEIAAASAPCVDKELAKALAYGADAAINVFVHDEQNHPITGACVRCGFWLQTANLSPAVYGKTDNTGHFVAKAKCNDDVTIVVKCDGYYGATVRKVMTKITTDPKVINGRWHPYGMAVKTAKNGRLIYLTGFLEGSDATRVKLLSEAIGGLVAGCRR